MPARNVLLDHRAFEFSEHTYDLEHSLARWRGGVDALLGIDRSPSRGGKLWWPRSSKKHVLHDLNDFRRALTTTLTKSIDVARTPTRICSAAKHEALAGHTAKLLGHFAKGIADVERAMQMAFRPHAGWGLDCLAPSV
jgi:hypothetical protein